MVYLYIYSCIYIYILHSCVKLFRNYFSARHELNSWSLSKEKFVIHGKKLGNISYNRIKDHIA